MLLAVTVLIGALLGWEAAKEGLLLTVPSAVAVAAVLTLAGYLRFLVKGWRGVVGRLFRHGRQTFQREAVGTLAWSLLFRLLIMGVSGILVYLALGLYR